MSCEMGPIQRLEEFKLVRAGWGRNIRRRREVEDRRALAAQLGALIDRGQPSGGPVPEAVHGQSARIAENDIRRQVLAFCAESIKDPRAPGGPAGLELPAVNDSQ